MERVPKRRRAPAGIAPQSDRLPGQNWDGRKERRQPVRCQSGPSRFFQSKLALECPGTQQSDRRPMNVIRGKKALVTGAASGIGRAIAIALAREGAALYLLDIDRVGLANTVREAESHGVEVTSTICDLREPGEVSAAVAALSARWGELHILVNN